ncbi:unnamed protein product [Phaeothamnion confervicola]
MTRCDETATAVLDADNEFGKRATPAQEIEEKELCPKNQQPQLLGAKAEEEEELEEEELEGVEVLVAEDAEGGGFEAQHHVSTEQAAPPVAADAAFQVVEEADPSPTSTALITEPDYELSAGSNVEPSLASAGAVGGAAAATAPPTALKPTEPGASDEIAIPAAPAITAAVAEAAADTRASPAALAAAAALTARVLALSVPSLVAQESAVAVESAQRALDASSSLPKTPGAQLPAAAAAALPAARSPSCTPQPVASAPPPLPPTSPPLPSTSPTSPSNSPPPPAFLSSPMPPERWSDSEDGGDLGGDEAVAAASGRLRDLYVTGYAASVLRNDEAARQLEDGAHLRPLRVSQNLNLEPLQLDRFDVRWMLDPMALAAAPATYDEATELRTDAERLYGGRYDGYNGYGGGGRDGGSDDEEAEEASESSGDVDSRDGGGSSDGRRPRGRTGRLLARLWRRRYRGLPEDDHSRELPAAALAFAPVGSHLYGPAFGHERLPPTGEDGRAVGRRGRSPPPDAGYYGPSSGSGAEGELSGAGWEFDYGASTVRGASHVEDSCKRVAGTVASEAVGAALAPAEAAAEAEALFEADFPLPEGMVAPATAKAHTLIVRTAKTTRRSPQLEVLLRVREANNAALGFLQTDHELHPYYAMLRGWSDQRLQEEADKQAALQQQRAEEKERRQREEAEEAAAAAAASTAAATGVVSTAAAETGSAIASKGASATSAGAAVEIHGEKQKGAASLASSTGLLGAAYGSSDEESTDDGSDADLSLDAADGSNQAAEAVMPPLAVPPRETQAVIEKVVAYVARNGPAFEERVRQQQGPGGAVTGRFAFLWAGHAYHPFYRVALTRAIGDPAPAEQLLPAASAQPPALSGNGAAEMAVTGKAEAVARSSAASEGGTVPAAAPSGEPAGSAGQLQFQSCTSDAAVPEATEPLASTKISFAIGTGVQRQRGSAAAGRARSQTTEAEADGAHAAGLGADPVPVAEGDAAGSDEDASEGVWAALAASSASTAPAAVTADIAAAPLVGAPETPVGAARDVSALPVASALKDGLQTEDGRTRRRKREWLDHPPAGAMMLGATVTAAMAAAPGVIAAAVPMAAATAATAAAAVAATANTAVITSAGVARAVPPVEGVVVAISEPVPLAEEVPIEAQSADDDTAAHSAEAAAAAEGAATVPLRSPLLPLRAAFPLARGSAKESEGAPSEGTQQALRLKRARLMRDRFQGLTADDAMTEDRPSQDHGSRRSRAAAAAAGADAGVAGEAGNGRDAFDDSDLAAAEAMLEGEDSAPAETKAEQEAEGGGDGSARGGRDGSRGASSGRRSRRSGGTSHRSRSIGNERHCSHTRSSRGASSCGRGSQSPIRRLSRSRSRSRPRQVGHHSSSNRSSSRARSGVRSRNRSRSRSRNRSGGRRKRRARGSPERSSSPRRDASRSGTDGGGGVGRRRRRSGRSHSRDGGVGGGGGDRRIHRRERSRSGGRSSSVESCRSQFGAQTEKHRDNSEGVPGRREKDSRGSKRRHKR